MLVVILLWFIVPWFVFSMYSGEISDYYFGQTKPIAIIILAFTMCELMNIHKALKAICVVLLIYWCVINVQIFETTKYSTLPKMRRHVLNAMSAGQPIEFSEGNPEAYIYYIYTHGLGIKP
jgi:4-amino-4-deoxy-L-arabinose transferase-like glycosyltransferase